MREIFSRLSFFYKEDDRVEMKLYSLYSKRPFRGEFSATNCPLV